MNFTSNNKQTKTYDLELRTAKFAEDLIIFCRKLEQDTITKPIISQIIRSGTSIGANYREANGASSKKDFKNKIFICKKEAEETKYWLQMLAKCFDNKKTEIRTLWKECQELTMIFQKIVNTIREKT